jgi:tripartite ATP-independent transporter DctP family solute receptor
MKGPGAAILVLALSGCAETGTLELTLAHVTPPESMIALAADEFARVANERLAGRARVVVYGAGQLGDDREVLQKLKLGTVDLAVPSTVLSADVPALALFEMPYLVRDREHMRRIAEEIFWPELAPRAEARGYRVLALWENGFRHITNSRRPIVEPTDLADIKLRTPNSPWRVALFRAMGANPSPMPFSEVFLALQTGVMDGQENPLTNVRNASLDEVQTYLSLTGHVYSPAYVTVGLEPWAELPEDVRRVLEDVARETEAFALETAERVDAQVLEELRARGMRINEVDRSSFVEASRAVYAAFDHQVPGGADWITRALALATEGEQ